MSPISRAMSNRAAVVFVLLLSLPPMVSMTANIYAQDAVLEPGVSLALATQRKSVLSDINYALRFQIPEAEDDAIPASATITFSLADNSAPLVLDFREEGDKIHSVARNGSPSDYRFEQEHLIIPAAELRSGRNIDAAFELHGAALDFLEDYTGIDYPFQKFDFALIPGFQYGGMEHVGAIQRIEDTHKLRSIKSRS